MVVFTVNHCPASLLALNIVQMCVSEVLNLFGVTGVTASTAVKMVFILDQITGNFFAHRVRKTRAVFRHKVKFITDADWTLSGLSHVSSPAVVFDRISGCSNSVKQLWVRVNSSKSKT